MSRMWAWTLTIVAMGLSFVLGMALVMFLVFKPQAEPSNFLQQFAYHTLLDEVSAEAIVNDPSAASQPRPNWSVTDQGTLGFGGRAQVHTRRFIAEATVNPPDQAIILRKLRDKIQAAATKHGGSAYVGMTGGSSGSTTVNGKTHNQFRDYANINYHLNGRSGLVILTAVGEGDQLIITAVIIEE